MNSILNQLAKYHPLTAVQDTRIAPPKDPIHIKQAKHPYETMVERLCDIADFEWRKQVINDSLLALNNFVPPPMADQLYPIEIAVLYHLFYHHKITLCSETRTDQIMGAFLKAVVERDGDLTTYMQTLKGHLDKNAAMIFLYRVMLAALGARGKYDNKRDLLSREYGIRAAMALGVQPTAKMAGCGLDSVQHASDVEQQILGRITYIAFWEWSRLRPISNCGSYLALPVSGDTQELAPTRQTLAALPPHQS